MQSEYNEEVLSLLLPCPGSFPHTRAVNSQNTSEVGTVLSPTLKMKQLMLIKVKRLAKFTEQMCAKGRHPGLTSAPHASELLGLLRKLVCALSHLTPPTQSPLRGSWHGLCLVHQNPLTPPSSELEMEAGTGPQT